MADNVYGILTNGGGLSFYSRTEELEWNVDKKPLISIKDSVGFYRFFDGDGK